MPKVITGKVRLSYAQLFEPKAAPGSTNLKYSTAVLIPKSDTKTVDAINTAVAAAVEEGKASKWGGKIPPVLKKPLRDGDVEKPDDPNYAGHWFFNASSGNKPGIAKPIGKDAEGKTKFQEIEDTTEVYSGCYAKVSVNFYPFFEQGSKGVAAGLNNVVKVQDGEALAGKASVESDFEEEEFDEDDDDFLD